MPTRVGFIEPMLLLKTNLSDGYAWRYELKLDGIRSIAFKRSGEVHLRSKNNKDFSARYSEVVKALSTMPDETDRR